MATKMDGGYQVTQAEAPVGVAAKKPGETHLLTVNQRRRRQKAVTKTTGAIRRRMMNGFGYQDHWHDTWDTWIRPAITL